MENGKKIGKPPKKSKKISQQVWTISKNGKPNRINVRLAFLWFALHENKANFDSWIEGKKLPSIQL